MLPAVPFPMLMLAVRPAVPHSGIVTTGGMEVIVEGEVIMLEGEVIALVGEALAGEVPVVTGGGAVTVAGADATPVPQAAIRATAAPAAAAASFLTLQCYSSGKSRSPDSQAR